MEGSDWLTSHYSAALPRFLFTVSVPGPRSWSEHWRNDPYR